MRIFKSSALALMLALGGLAPSAAPAFAQPAILVRVNVPPPPLPIYLQPPLPGPGYLWAPGYWAWDGDDYFWVPGTWVLAPAPGLLWTPGYWGWNEGLYVFNTGYWGPHVGFYGGIPYGFGYGGVGYAGGYWNNGAFFYNRAYVNVVNIRLTNVYNAPAAFVPAPGRVSFNGGAGGVAARPMPIELAAAGEAHVAPVALQVSHQQAASGNAALKAAANNGNPPIAATATPGAFSGKAVVPAMGAPANLAKSPATPGPKIPAIPGPKIPMSQGVKLPGANPLPAGANGAPAPKVNATKPAAAPLALTPPPRQALPTQAAPQPRYIPQQQALPQRRPPNPRALPPRRGPGQVCGIPGAPPCR